MPGPHEALALLAVSAVVIAVPGPSVLFIVSRAVALGRRAALLTVVGNELGLLTQGAAVAVGLGAAVERSTAVYTGLRLAGAAYLVWLGVQAVRHRGRTAAQLHQVPARSGRTTVRQGFVVGVSNPKTLLVFAALLPQFVDTAAGHAAAQLLVLSVVPVAVALVNDTAWALVADTARQWFARSPRRIAAVGGAGGLALVGLGTGLALTGRPD